MTPTKAQKRQRWRRLGHLLPLVLLLAWWKLDFNPAVLGALSTVTLLFGLFAAPVPCGATNRDGVTFCRNNAKGLIRGCTIRQHKWQNAKMLLRRQSWARFGAAVLRGIEGKAAALTAISGFLSVGATLAAAAIN